MQHERMKGKCECYLVREKTFKIHDNVLMSSNWGLQVHRVETETLKLAAVCSMPKPLLTYTSDASGLRPCMPLAGSVNQ